MLGARPVMVWVGKRFIGHGGVDDGEGVWIREGSLIHYRPDEKAVPYGGHNDNAWIWESDSFEGMVWKVLTTVGSQQVVAFYPGVSVVPFKPRPCGTPFLTIESVRCVYPKSSWMKPITRIKEELDQCSRSFFKWLFPRFHRTEQRYVFKRAGDQVVHRNLMKPRTGILITILSGALDSVYQATSDYQKFSEAFPERSLAASVGTSEYVYATLANSTVDIPGTLSNVSSAWNSLNVAIRTAGISTEIPEEGGVPFAFLAKGFGSIFTLASLAWVWRKLALCGPSSFDCRMWFVSILQKIHPRFYVKAHSLITQPVPMVELPPALPAGGSGINWFKLVGLSLGGIGTCYVLRLLAIYVRKSDLYSKISRRFGQLPFRWPKTRKATTDQEDVEEPVVPAPYVRPDVIAHRYEEWHGHCDHFYDHLDRRIPKTVVHHVFDIDPSRSFVPGLVDCNHHPPPELWPSSEKKGVLQKHLPPTSGLWAIMMPQVPVFTFCNTGEALGKCIDYRILAMPPMDPGRQAVAWEKVPPLPISMVHFDADDVLFQEAWLRHMTPKKASKYRPILEDFKHGIVNLQFEINVLVKCDEALTKAVMDVSGAPDQEGDLLVDLKPRAIANVNPRVQAAIGPSIYAVTQHMKATYGWDSEPIKLPSGTQMQIYFAAGASDLSLSRWFSDAVLKLTVPCLIVMGDDMLLIVTIWNGKENEGGSMRIAIEGDASMFDQSQSMGPLERQAEFMANAGMSPKVLDIWRQIHYGKFVATTRARSGAESSRMTFTMPNRPIRLSGCADTTLGNSLSSIYAAMYTVEALFNNETKVIYHDCSLERDLEELRVKVVASYAELGFKMKVKMLAEPTCSTFLKGMFLPTIAQLGDPSFFWTTLPSKLLKIGKSKTDPCVLYSAAVNREQASRMFMEDVCRSLRPGIHGPIMAAFLLKFGDESHTPRREDWEVTFVTGGSVLIDPQSAIQLYAKRYDVDELMITDFITWLGRWNLFTVLAHTLFIRMMLVDYS